MRIWQRTTMAIVILLGLVACDGSAVYMACVDQITPEIPGLIVREHGPTPQGIILITNKTGEDLYLLDQGGHEVLWMKATGELLRRSSSEDAWENLGNKETTIYSDEPVAYYGPRPEKRGMVVSTWIVRGRVNDMPFEIHGRTVYKSKSGSCD